MKIKIPILLLLTALSLSTKAQTVFEDASGESVLIKNADLKDWFNIRINTASESFTLSYIGTRNLKDGQVKNSTTEMISRRSMLGFDLKLKVKDGIGNVYKQGKLNTGISAALIWGIQKENYDTKTPIYTRPRSFYLKAGLSYDKYAMLDTLNYSKTELKKLQPFASLNKNWFYTSKTSNDHPVYSLAGISFGYKVTNNTEDLDDGIGSTLLGSAPNYSVGKQDAGKLGDYQTYHSFPLRLDYGILPRLFGKNILGINAFARAGINEPKTPINLGTGVFFSKDNEPTNVVGGFGWQFNNVVHKSLMSNSSVFVYIGYTIQ